MAKIDEPPEAAENAEKVAGGNQAEEKVGGEQAEISKDARMWAMFCHLAGLAGYVMPIVGSIIGPLIFWQIKKDEYPFVDEQGKEAVNFQISMVLYAIVSLLLFVICVGPFLLAAVGVVDIVLLIIAAVKANNGQSYRYPLTIRFIK